MRPEDYAKIVLRRWWLIPLIALVAATVAYWYTDRQPRVYTSSTELFVVGEPPGYWNDLLAKNRLAPFKKLVSSGGVAQRAVEQDGLGEAGLDAGGVLSRLAVAHNPDTNTIQIAASDSDPVRAARIANAVARSFIAQVEADNEQLARQFRRETESGQTITIERVRAIQLGEAGPAAVPSAPRPKLNAAAAAILGVALALVLAFAIEYLDDTLRSAEDVRRHLDLPTIAGIPGGGSGAALPLRRGGKARSGGDPS